ncbi:MAG: branched-chain amino acid ABC transporter permease [Acidimicrobiia bacterium]
MKFATNRTIRIAGLVLIAAMFLLPMFGSDFFVDFVMTRTLILGLGAVTLIYLAAYGGMISLAQWLIVGVSGFMIGNAVADAGSKGLKLGMNDWVAVVFAVFVSTVLAMILGALSSRTTGIYFLMLTFVYAVIGFYFFGQVTTFSGFGGITGIDPPSFFNEHPERIYYAALILSIGAYFLFRALAKTPFGMALQGVRDDPVRMASLGFNVPVIRTIAFTLAGFVAAFAGILNVWWNGQIDPNSISTGPTLDLLIVAVIGGIAHLEGAWIGAFVFVIANNYMRNLPFVDAIGITEARFNTIIGIVMLLILVLSPDGIMGIAGKGRDVLRPKEPSEGSEDQQYADSGSE